MHWPLLPAPMINGTGLALRPALTELDRQRFQQMAPMLPIAQLGVAATYQAQLIRTDLIEDKIHGGVIGTACVLKAGNRFWNSFHLQAMHSDPATRSAVAKILRLALPRSGHINAPRDTSETDDEPTLRRAFSDRQSAALGIPEGYAEQHQLSWIDEPARLHYAGRDYVGRTLWLQHGAMQAWQNLRRAALATGIRLEAVSGFRSIGYQAGILRRKLERGLSVAQVLAINTAPGYSEHHSGRAIDVGTPGCAPAEEAFESTPAFAWLREHAAQYGFRMSYPRDNPHGVIYEPWHWYWQG